MNEKPILFSNAMVRALLAGTKTQTRRVVKLRNGLYMPPSQRADINGWNQMLRLCPYGQPGDRLWVREGHRLLDCSCTETCRVPGHVYYEADGGGYFGAFQGRLRPSIHMPRWASRITLEVTGVRVERSQDISEADAIAEGTFSYAQELYRDPRVTTADIKALIAKYGEGKASYLYAALWESINGPGSWDANPWVWVVEFKRVQP